MKKFLLLLLIASSFIGAKQGLAVVPLQDKIGKPAITTCPVGTVGASVYHADKIVFLITGALTALSAADQAALNAMPRNRELDIKVSDDPKKVADIKSKTLTFLGASVNVAANFTNIKIVSVSYAAIMCVPLI